jgi:hypothetical protein
MTKQGCLVLCFLYFADISIVVFQFFFLFLICSIFLFFIQIVDGSKVFFFFVFVHFVMSKIFANSFQIISKINPIYTRKTTLFFFNLGCPPLLRRIFFGSNSKSINWNYVTSSSTPKKHPHPLRSLSSKHRLKSLNMVVGREKLVWWWAEISLFDICLKICASVWH